MKLTSTTTKKINRIITREREKEREREREKEQQTMGIQGQGSILWCSIDLVSVILSIILYTAAVSKKEVFMTTTKNFLKCYINTNNNNINMTMLIDNDNNGTDDNTAICTDNSCTTSFLQHCYTSSFFF